MLIPRRLALAGLMLLTACAPAMTLEDRPKPLGDFRLGYTVVVVDQPAQGPLSRTATDDELKAALEMAIKERFGRFEGTGEYHIAAKLELYSLGQPGIPIVLSPKSAFLLAASVWRPTGKINAKPEGLTVFEGLSGKNVLGSGIGQTREEQIERLAFNAALEIEKWLRKHPEWFVPDGPIGVVTEPSN